MDPPPQAEDGVQPSGRHRGHSTETGSRAAGLNDGSRFGDLGDDTDAMRMPARLLRLGVIVGTIVALATAGIGLAAVGSDPLPDEITSCQPSGTTPDGDILAEEDDQGNDEAEETEETEEIEQAEEADQAEGSEATDGSEGAGECDDPADGAESEGAVEATAEGTPETASADEPSPERIAACTEAAGLTAADAPTEKPEAGELHGLENAIAHVLWNCTRNDNDGLPNALTQLKENLDRKLLHDELKADREAEREAAKAARRAAHAANDAHGSTHAS